MKAVAGRRRSVSGFKAEVCSEEVNWGEGGWSTNLAALQRLDHRLLIHNCSSRRVDQDCTISHLPELLSPESAFRLVVERQVQGDNVGSGEQARLGGDVFAREGGWGSDFVPVVVDDLHVETEHAAGVSLRVRQCHS